MDAQLGTRGASGHSRTAIRGKLFPVPTDFDGSKSTLPDFSPVKSQDPEQPWEELLGPRGNEAAQAWHTSVVACHITHHQTRPPAMILWPLCCSA